MNKIAFFAPNLTGGGAERVVSILAAQFAEAGYQVDLILAEAIGPYLANLPSSVHVIDLQCKRVLFTLPRLIKYLYTEKPAVLFSSQMHSSTVALWAAKLSGAKTRVYIRQPTMLKPFYGKQSLISKLRQKIFLLSAKSAEKVIVTSKAMADEFHALSNVAKDKIQVVYNPVPIDAIKGKSLEPIEHPWLKTSEPPVILAVGRLVEVKDFKTLIKAFSIVQKKIPARLLILGEGLLRNELEEQIELLGITEHVLMPGFVSNPYQYMRHAKVFVLSSLWEGFPNGMIEAMACDARIVATECEGGTIEILGGGQWGELVPVGNEHAMAQAILKTLSSEFAPNAPERVEIFSIDNIFKQYLKLFQIEKY